MSEDCNDKQNIRKPNRANAKKDSEKGVFGKQDIKEGDRMSLNDRAVKDFVKNIGGQQRTGSASERSYYPAICDLITAFENIQTQIEATDSLQGIPDISVKRRNNVIGYIEVKNTSMDLDTVDQNQKQRYISAYDNLIYTNLIEWRLYRNHAEEPVKTVNIASIANSITIIRDNIDDFIDFLTLFIGADPQSIGATRGLATELARLARILRNETKKHQAEDNFLGKLLKAFRDELISDLTEDDFADMYAQTISYGILTARNMNPEGYAFDRQIAVKQLPQTNPFLKRVFSPLANPEHIDERLPESIICVIDDIASLVKSADMGAINAELNNYEKNRTKRDISEADKDPIIYFYEYFLAEYDPSKRKGCGVYYTPLPVVDYIVRSIDKILKEKIGIPDGLANENVTILDPACGSGTFLYEVVNHVYQSVGVRSLADWKNEYVPALLKRMFGFELLMAPYTIAHFKIAKKLQDTSYDFKDDERLGIFLTNTLEEGKKRDEVLGLQGHITHEGNEAAKIKNDEKIMVILGNPPYNAKSKNHTLWINGKQLINGQTKTPTKAQQKGLADYRSGGLMADYKPEGGEQNPRLDDDYVKFIRFAHWKITQVEKGIVAMITNSSFIDGVTHRTMRAKLLREFDEIHIFDLHGKQGNPADDNIFQITSINVAITIFVKTGNNPNCDAVVTYYDVYGRKDDKLKVLSNNDYETIEKEIVDIPAFESEYSKTCWSRRIPYWKFFKPMENESVGLTKEYGYFWGMTDIFPHYNSGIKTGRDKKAYNVTARFTQEEISDIVRNFIRLSTQEIRELYGLPEDSRDWSIARAKKDIEQRGIKNEFLSCYSYRPFDIRFTYFYNKSSSFLQLPRYDTMKHFTLGSNLGIVFYRNNYDVEDIDHFFVTNVISDIHLCGGQSYVAPLYIYHDADLQNSTQTKMPNFTNDFKTYIEGKYNKQPSPEVILGYIYSIFYCPTFRSRYLELLKIDFPRVPFADDEVVFYKLSELGTKLIDLHLLNNPDWGEYKQIGEAADSTIGKVHYSSKEKQITLDMSKPPEERVIIGNVPQDVWDYKIGGYKVIENWLKGRDSRQVSIRDVCHILNAITKTIEIQKAIDEIYLASMV